MAFDFRLKTLLEYRQHLLKNGQVALAQAQQRYRDLYTERDQLKRQIDQQEKVWRKHQAEGMQVAQHLSCIRYLNALEQNLLSLERQLADALDKVDAARDALLRKETEVQMLESLKTKAREEYRYDELKREQKRLDATAIFADYQKREKIPYE